MSTTITVELCEEDRELIRALVASNVGGLAATGILGTPAKEEKKKPAPEPDPDEEEEEEEEVDAAEGPTREQVRAKLKEYAALETKDAAIEILSKHGASSIGELDEDQFQAVIDACDA